MKRLLLLALLFSLLGCAGARTQITAPTAKYPISLTHAVRAADGTLLSDAKRKVVGKLRSDKTGFAMLYSAIPITTALDISDDVNEQVAAAGGDAVVNLNVHAKVCALDWFVVFHLLPIWPGCGVVRATGTIIKATAP